MDAKQEKQEEFHSPTKLKRQRLIITSPLPGDEAEADTQHPREARPVNDDQIGSETKDNTSTRPPPVAPELPIAAVPAEVQDEQPQAAGSRPTCKRTLAVLGPFLPEAVLKMHSKGLVYTEQVATLMDSQNQLRHIIAEAVGHGRELLLFHLLLMDTENRPVLGGQYVHENDLYQPLFNNSFERVSVFQIVKRIPNLGNAKPASISPQVIARSARNLTQLQNNEDQQSDTPGFNCDLQFYLLEIEGKTAWDGVYSALAKVVSRVQDEPGFTAESAVSQLTETCAGTTFTATSGIYCRMIIPPEIPECLDVDVEQRQQSEDAREVGKSFKEKPHNESPPINSADDLPHNVVEQASSSQESVPLEISSEEQVSHGLQQNPHHVEQSMQIRAKQTQKPAKSPAILPEPPLEDVTKMPSKENPRPDLCNELALIEEKLSRSMSLKKRNVSIGIIISAYEAHELPERKGAKNDNRLIRRISRRFQCSEADINLLFNATAAVTKEDITAHLEKFVKKYRGSTLHQIFLFVSAHGTECGMVTSTGEIVSLKELLLPLLPLAKHVVLFYQPCRGDLLHSPTNAAVLSGVSFASVDTAGSCLPASMLTCSALYASMPLYSSFHAKMGSLMLFALHEVAYKPELTGQVITLVNMAQMTQYEIFALLHKVFEEFKSVQIMNYTVRDGSSIEVSKECVKPEQTAVKKIMPADFTQPFKIHL